MRKGDPEGKSSNLRKYETGNPAMQWVIRRFVDNVLDTVERLAPEKIVDLGCGEGIIATPIVERLPQAEYLGVDVSPKAVDIARDTNPELEFQVGSLLDAPARPHWADLAICLEVIEHLPDPDRSVEHVLQWTHKAALFSVPWEPYFRLGNFLRGKYLRRCGNHPEHVQQFRPGSLHALLSRHSSNVQVWTSFPWILGLARNS